MHGRNDLVLILILFSFLAQLDVVAIENSDRPNVVASAEPKNPVPYSRIKRAPLPPHSLSFARVFGEHMVLQSGQPIRVWGQAKPNAAVTVSFGGQKTSTSSDSTGNWLVELLPEKQNSTPQRLIVNSGDESVTLNDILVGEVWFCAGQSNMEWPLSKTTNGVSAIKSSDDGLLRLLNFPGGARGSSGKYNAEHFARLVPENFSSGSWAVASPASTCNFSGVGYYFAKELRKTLGCPVGIINVSVGGTPVEAWVSSDRLKAHPNLSRMISGNWLNNPELDKWSRDRARSNLQRGLEGEFDLPGDEFGPNHSFKPGFMHAASVKPFQPMSIRGVLWYQGESNADNQMYAWSPFPEPPVNLVNSDGMPASPFTTEDENEIPYDIRMIWNAAPHNAFTDLVRWNDKFYCAFRIGTGHVPGKKGEDGKIQLISSVDGKKWSSIATIAEPGIDLRDPKLSITPDGRLMVLMGGSNYEGPKLIDRASRVAFLENEDNDFSKIRRIEIDPGIAGNNDWLWRVTWDNGVGYGVVYQADKTRWGLHLVKTYDGVKYDLVKTFDLKGRPNESTVRFDSDGQMLLVIRNEDRRSIGHFGQSKPPFTKWNWNVIKHRLGGPNMIQLPDGRWLLGTREYGETAKTVLGSLSIDGQFNTLITFPSGGDTSYPGMLIHGDKLWFSYYASHEGRTSIYLATIALQDLGVKATGKNE